MKISSIQNYNYNYSNQKFNTNFTGKFMQTEALEEFKTNLNSFQKYILEKNITRMESVKDGRVFKYDYCNDGTVGIFEKNNIQPKAKEWFMLIQSPKERAAWCFDELNKIYRNILITKGLYFNTRFGKKEQ